MRLNPLSLLAIVVIMYTSLVRVTDSSNTEHLLTAERFAAFHEWINVHDKEYETDVEMKQRMMTWAENDGMFVV